MTIPPKGVNNIDFIIFHNLYGVRLLSQKKAWDLVNAV